MRGNDVVAAEAALSPSIEGRYRIRISKSDEDFEAMQELDERFFPGAPEDAANWRGGSWWVLEYRTGDEIEIVGYAGARLLPPPDVGSIYMCRAGVLSEHRGHGFQKRLIRVRLNWARRQGYKHAVTYTIKNPASANSLIACGFRAYNPEAPWIEGDEVSFWWRDLRKR